MNRRELFLSTAGLLSAGALASAKDVKTRMGVVTYCLNILRKARKARGGEPDLGDPLNLLEYARGIGAGGIQTSLGGRDRAYAANLRDKAGEYGMFVDAIAGLPRDRADLERFEAEIRTAKQAGAGSVRVVMLPGRRYERFDSMEEYRQLSERGVRSLELAEPVARRQKIRLALENHKGQRMDERLELLKRLDSEYVGTCVDVGNSFALLEDPMEVVEAYAPWAASVHLKDQAVREYEDGFLFADVALGDGFLDLVNMVKVLRKTRPEPRFSLETITRDPLEVPCLAEKYWATFADVPGRDLARTMRTVRAHAWKKPLPRISDLSLDEQVKREEDNVRRSLVYARERLGL